MVLHGYHNVTAIDNDAKLLPCVEASLAPFLHVECMDAMQLQIAPASIDAVVAKAFFELLAVSTQCAVLTQVLACLRPGGTLFVVALNNGKAWWTQPDVARLLARTAVCIDDQPVGPIVGSRIDRSHACRARVWRTRASVIDANHRANCDAIRTLAARYEWRLRAFERQLQTEEAVHGDVLCLELPQMMNEDFRSLLLRQEARSRTNDKDIARAQVLKEPSVDEQAAPCANLASPATATIIPEPPISARTESRNESLHHSGSDLRAYPDVVVSPHEFSDLGDEAFATEATDGDAACPPLESESYGASETRHGVAVALVTHVLADAAALASSPVKKRTRPGVAATETRLESHDHPQPRGIDPVHGVAVALVNHVIADVAAHVPSPRKAVLLQSQRSTATDTVLEGQQNKVIASPGANLSTAAIKHGVAVALVTQLITDATERASSPKKPTPEATIESSLQEQGVAINNTSPDDDAEMSRVQAQATDAAVISETEHLSPVADENAPALGSMAQDTSKCMVESPKSSPHGAAIVDTTLTKEPERLPFQETDDNPDVADEVLEDATRAQDIEAPALATEAAAVPQAFESAHALLPSSLLRANCEVDPAACTNDDAPPSQRMRDAAPSVHPSSADGCALNEVGGILARLVDDVENECIKDDCRLTLAALIDALLS
ncbi:hypothetical protein SPRG_22100 [Saprolegnia parasitica CBS 223.65]|uniref:Methyltransferase type 11 domain-containing protein n=1 Tax=Saprolegnia parasitica (strain CBS 223.65) TaxID=695850 RepID=A0A067D3Z9_SAPPC|nr:hypothetical protein SPRG_22100 [Saprolegnia parasitica CBS 223.65]KDO33737.1 hypothetical protein SPRG_22100 [Saprolegnia parasitica CBS 223.65]|eukprot:XP_012195778.1 hypothetical protein SPRG_22100 [Saprolegnia parasitica CBS 223.65]